MPGSSGWRLNMGNSARFALEIRSLKATSASRDNELRIEKNAIDFPIHATSVLRKQLKILLHQKLLHFIFWVNLLCRP
jgi:hypothetical protein